MKFHLLKLAVYLSAGLIIAMPPLTHAFALLGPVQPWMQATNGVISAGDIGGPMYLNNGYRWNVPVVTYGFDQSFLDYFGSNGVAAVESAIAILNALPPASGIAPTNYPFLSSRINFTAESQSLYDLKSQALSLLLEQMGLADPVRYLFTLRQWNPAFLDAPFPSEATWPSNTIPNYIVELNFDPVTLNPSTNVNEIAYEAYLEIQANQYDIITFPTDPGNPTYPAVAGFNLEAGEYYTGLTYDDVGGLAYLLSTNNINYETLLPGVLGVGTNANSFVNAAWRPGVDKITFIPHPVGSLSGTFQSTTNYFTDNYIANGFLKQQQVARIISQPDFIFSAGDAVSSVPEVMFFKRTGTTNWLNNAAANGNTNGAGPGVIQPQVQIVFNKLGRTFEGISDEQVFDESQFYSSFDGTTSSPVYYPSSQQATNQLTVRMWLATQTSPSLVARSFEWKPTSASGAPFTLQTSTNLTEWTNLFTVTNDGSVCTYFNFNHTSPSRFYRLNSQ